MLITTNIMDRDELCEQITPRTVSRLTEMCDELQAVRPRPEDGHSERLTRPGLSGRPRRGQSARRATTKIREKPNTVP